ncbi:MerR family DNA-binding transcriptional regulator [Alicyclobacillaceae bacterium I2511]|nr:MerR family DNA-binding transcriptional regulator [Alicyclobacillaceae bacterium I2511]
MYNMIMETEEFLPVGKVAKLLGVTPQTIRRWQKEGRIQETRSPTNRRLYWETFTSVSAKDKTAHQRDGRGCDM